jgi:hypothetical protein
VPLHQVLSSSGFWKSWAHYYARGYDLKALKIASVSITSNVNALLVTPEIHTPTFKAEDVMNM